MKHCTLAFLCVLTILVVPSRASAQRCEGPCPYAPGYWTLGLLFHQGVEDADLLFSGGYMLAHGEAAPWMLRLDGMAGVNFYTSLPKNVGWLAGSQLGLLRVITGDYLALDDISAEIYFGASGGAYYGWTLYETPEDRGWVPAVQANLGVRFRGPNTSSSLVMIELTREERIGVWNPRWMLRITGGLPRLGGRSP